MEPDACLGYRISTPFPLIFHSQSPPPGEVRSSHLRCCASLKESSLFLHSRAEEPSGLRVRSEGSRERGGLFARSRQIVGPIQRDRAEKPAGLLDSAVEQSSVGQAPDIWPLLASLRTKNKGKRGTLASNGGFFRPRAGRANFQLET